MQSENPNQEGWDPSPLHVASSPLLTVNSVLLLLAPTHQAHFLLFSSWMCSLHLLGCPPSPLPLPATAPSVYPITPTLKGYFQVHFKPDHPGGSSPFPGSVRTTEETKLVCLLIGLYASPYPNWIMHTTS